MLDDFIQQYVVAVMNKDMTYVEYISLSTVIESYANVKNLDYKTAADMIVTFIIKPVKDRDWVPRMMLQDFNGAIIGWLLPVFDSVTNLQPRQL